MAGGRPTKKALVWMGRWRLDLCASCTSVISRVSAWGGRGAIVGESNGQNRVVCV